MVRVLAWRRSSGNAHCRGAESLSREFASREQLVIEAYADALMDVPRCLAENYGLNPTDTLLELKNGTCRGQLQFWC